MRGFRSIRLRFTVWYLAILAVLLSGLAVGLHAYLAYTLQRTQDDALVHRAAELSSTRETAIALQSGQVQEGLGEIVAFFQESGDGYRVISARPVEQDIDLAWIDAAFEGFFGHYTARTRDGTLLRYYVSRLLPPTERPALPEGAQAPPRPEQNDRNDPQSAELPQPTIVVVGQPMDRSVAALAALRTTLWIAIPLTLLLSAGGGLFLVRRALIPVDRMIETTRGIEERALGERIPVSSDDELGRLARTLNAMLGRLERAFHRQREFTDDASHELRSPLSVIEAEATLALRRDRPAEEYRGSLELVAEEAGKMNHLIGQLLTLARGDAGEESTTWEPVSMAALAEDVIRAMRPLAEEKGVRLQLGTQVNSATEPRCTGDVTQLKRVLANLIENAIRHTEENDDIAVLATLEASTAVWEVRDTGFGIPEEHLPHIFERFYRADKARSRQSGGSGLGLAICKQIVERHGGRIDVESSVGEGTVFRIYLPRLES